MNTPPRPRTRTSRAVHPMFAELFLEAGEDSLLADEEEQRRSRRARRSRARRVMTTGNAPRPR